MATLGGLIIFEVLACLKLKHVIKMKWLFVIFPLIASKYLLSIYSLKRAKPIYDTHLTDTTEYYAVFILHAATAKLITALLLVASLTESFPSLVTEAYLLAFLLIACLTLWIAAVLYYSKKLQRVRESLPF